MLKLILGEHSTITNNQMNDYSHPRYKGLYEEILKDYNFRYGKFSPIPYPMHPQINHVQQQRNAKITRASSKLVGND